MLFITLSMQSKYIYHLHIMICDFSDIANVRQCLLICTANKTKILEKGKKSKWVHKKQKTKQNNGQQFKEEDNSTYFA